MAHIAIVGTEGSGKTVLMATLAKRFSQRTGEGIFLDPQKLQTAKYVENVWNTLQNGEWPPSTPPGEKFELQWRLHTSNGLLADVVAFDVAGQDLRKLFADEEVRFLNELPSHLKRIAEYIFSAVAVVFLINLKHVMADPESLENQWAVKYAMDHLLEMHGRRKFCLVLTQADEYKSMLTNPEAMRAAVQRHLPLVWGAHFASGEVGLYSLAAVWDTVVSATDEDSMPRRVPKKNFRSKGLNALMTWVEEQIVESLPPPPLPEPVSAGAWVRLTGRAIILGTALILILLWWSGLWPVFSKTVGHAFWKLQQAFDSPPPEPAPGTWQEKAAPNGQSDNGERRIPEATPVRPPQPAWSEFDESP